AFVDWLLHTTRLTRPKLRVVYDVFGESPLRESVLSHLVRHRESLPVRVGNAASEQKQLDVYGELVEACRISLVKPKDWSATCMECCTALANMFANTGANTTTAFG